MECSKSAYEALQEPAILHLIFDELSQRDLLIVQGVCRTWHSLITTSKSIQARLFLRPGPACAQDQPAVVNALLQETFQSFFDDGIYSDGFADGLGNAGPWVSVIAPGNGWAFEECGARLMRPEASWRKMIPCFPPPTQLQVHVADDDGEGDKVVRLNFSNNEPCQDVLPSQPTWLTFGLVHDIIESALIQHKPWRLSYARLEFPCGSVPYARRGWYPEISLDEDKFQECCPDIPGSVRIHLQPDRRTDKVLQKLRKKALAREEARRKGWHWCGNGKRGPPWIYRSMWTNEFHMDNAVTFSDIEWDEVQERGSSALQSSTPAVVQSVPVRRFLGIKFGRKRQ